MSYFLTLRKGAPGSLQFSPRYIFTSFDEAHETAERAVPSMGVEYLIEDERGPVRYRVST